MKIKEIKNVIIQAGGKGTRLQHLTRNKPKCLVSVNNKPLLYHVFDKFNDDTRFHIIGDYLYTTLARYLRVFSPKVKFFQLFNAFGTGTISGIWRALKRIPEDQPILLTWCDLILPELKNIEFDPTKNYVIYTNELTCRWSISNHRLIEYKSNQKGIPGIFILKNSKDFADIIPHNGEFVRWLSDSKFEFEELEIKGLTEVGTMEDFERVNSSSFYSRSFNSIEIEDDKIIKKPINDHGKSLIALESDWYKTAKQVGIKNIPDVFNYTNNIEEALIIKYYRFASHIFDYPEISIKAIPEILHLLKDLHSKIYSIVNYEDVKNTYIKKTKDRLKPVSKFLDTSLDFYIVNNKKCKNIIKGSFLDTIDIPCNKFTFIHGDPTMSNILYDRVKGEIILIDPRGYFGNTKYLGDPDYDFAKLYYSIIGGYDWVNRKKFNLEISGNNIVVNLHRNHNFWIEFEPLFSRYCDLSKIKLLHALIWLSFSGYVTDDFDSMLASYFLGIYYLQEYYDEK